MTNHLSDPAPVFGALSDPTRCAVVQRLTLGPAAVGTLAEPFDLALPTFLRHLKVLERAGLVTTRKQGRSRICQLQPDRLAEVEAWLRDTRALWEQRLDNLERYLEEGDTP